MNWSHDCTYVIRMRLLLPEEVQRGKQEDALLYERDDSLFWKANERGYTSDYRAAGRYSRAEAISICMTSRSHGRDQWIVLEEDVRDPFTTRTESDGHSSIERLPEEPVDD